MAYGVKYRLEFADIKGNKRKVEIFKNGYTGGVLPMIGTGEPVEIMQVKITNPARTVADCFKYRNKIGLNVALEALKEGLQEHRFTMDDLWQYAKLCRVSNVMRPYLESIL